MAKSRNQKGKLLYLAEIFHRETDEAHGLTLAEVTERLAAYGVQAERKTLYADMEELRRCGLDIDSWKEGREYRYRLASREFELPELKLQGASVYVNGDVALYMQTYFPNVPIPSYLYPVALPTTVVTLVAVVCWLLRVLLQGGWVLYHLGVRRGEEMPYATLFDGFGFIGKLILLNIVITLYVFLWSMLFIIPGIIAGYRYRFAVYNLCENPDIGVMEAISMSKAQTAGYKGDLFLLDLTFIGWNLLCSLTLGILSIWIAPYIIQTNIGYFQEIKRIKGIGWQARPEQPDDTFRPTDPFGPEL